MESERMSNLLYRNQFILGPRYAGGFPFWKQHEITPSVVITAHPDLNISHFSKNDNSLTLIGYLIDPQRPGHNNEQILNRLLSEDLVLTELIKATFELCGNWILIYKKNDKISLFHDCAGARSIVYTLVGKTKELWCASQPRLIADILDLNEEKKAIDFILTQKSKMTHNYCWPVDSSPYSEIKRLLPNNYLDLNRGEIYRYWPDKEIGKLQKNDAIEKISKRLKGIMSAAAKRFDLAICLSAGGDSRLMLAACKDIRQKVCVINGKSPGMSRKHPDIVIPKRLASRLKLDFHYIPPPKSADIDFNRILDMNAPYPSMETADMLQAVLGYYHLQKVGATGNILETARFGYNISKPAEIKPSGEFLASITKMTNAQFAIEAFENWLRSFDDVVSHNIYDLFYLEQRCGSWLSNNCLIANTSWKEVFYPFNCRNLLIDFLSVPDDHRMPPDYIFFKDLMRNMWPGVLSEPINPKPKVSLLFKSLKKLKKVMTLKQILY